MVDKIEDVGPALKKAIDVQMNEARPPSSRSCVPASPGDPFRRDAPSGPVRFLDGHKDYAAPAAPFLPASPRPHNGDAGWNVSILP